MKVILAGNEATKAGDPVEASEFFLGLVAS